VPEAPVVDLMEALKRSVAESKKKPAGEKAASSAKTKAAPKSGSRSRRAPARKSA
jgi:non-homologous end joining protein Ku